MKSKDGRFSLLTNNMTICYLTKRTDNIHIHEVFYGTANRKKSIKWGCCVPLTGEKHNQSSEGVHFNSKLDLTLKQEMQKAFEEKHSHELFMEVFCRNYL